MKNELFKIYETNDGIIIEISLRTVSLEDLEKTLQVIRALLPKG